ncbi:retrotransposon protein [Striga asiatica]|uniref:Retrotransposon protein n=1 Tax=Striga asiatica TaxID=4170 RepID=A0A5A7R0D0_STRAF|nr:retrotransposon protein [Striga asiatica]
MSFNPLSVILKENQLANPKPFDWKRNLDIVMSITMAKGTPVREHVQKLMEQFTRMESEGPRFEVCIKADITLFSLHKDLNMSLVFKYAARISKVWRIKRLDTLSPFDRKILHLDQTLSFLFITPCPFYPHPYDGDKSFIMSSMKNAQLCYSYNDVIRNMPVAELIRELEAAEKIIREEREMILDEREMASSSKFVGIKRKSSSVQEAVELSRAARSGQKVDCPLLKKGNSLFNIVETCLAVVSTRTWCVDNGATDHVCNFLQGFQETKRLKVGEITVYMGNVTKVALHRRPLRKCICRQPRPSLGLTTTYISKAFGHCPGLTYNMASIQNLGRLANMVPYHVDGDNRSTADTAHIEGYMGNRTGLRACVFGLDGGPSDRGIDREWRPRIRVRVLEGKGTLAWTCAVGNGLEMKEGGFCCVK